MGASDHTSLMERVVGAAARAAEGLDAAHRPLFESFCRAVVAQLRGPYLARHPADEIPAELLGLFQLSLRRSGDQIHCQVVASGARSATLRSCMPDQPFIVNTVRLLIQRQDAQYSGGFNAVLRIERDADGEMIAIGGDVGALESVVQIEVEGLSADALAPSREGLLRSLRLARAMVRDFTEMTDTVERVLFRFGRQARREPHKAETWRELEEFLQWLLTENFVFMGLALGDTRLGFDRVEALPWAPTDGRAHENEEIPIWVAKGDMESPVHRAGRVDEIHVQIPTNGGDDQRALRIRGMFTYRALTQPSRNVPVLRRVLARLLRDGDDRPGSWGYKGVSNIFDSLPTEFLFTANHLQIAEMIERVRDAEQEQQTQSHIVQDLDASNTTFVLTAMPRARYSEALRRRIQDRLEQRTQATYSDHGLFMGRFDTALLHFYLTGAKALSDERRSALCQSLQDLTTPWGERVYSALVEARGDGAASQLIARYGDAFADTYKEHGSTAQTLRDLENLEQLGADREVAVDVCVDHKDRVNVRVYQLGGALLTRSLPVLDNFGLVIVDQHSETARPHGGDEMSLDTFRIHGAMGLDRAQVLARSEKLARGIEAVFSGAVENDGLNRLVLRADISWQEADLLRAYVGYARQLGVQFTDDRTQQIFLHHPELVQALLGAFHARFDPALEGERDAGAAFEAVEDGLRTVNNHDEDLLFRRISQLMQATQRTNFFRTDKKGHYISFKIAHDHPQVEWMPRPRMMFEVYVHHAEMEGLHLRGGKVARGGLRWSDRTDYRTEVMGLVSTQMVKNVLIVPEGSKGGFRMKRDVADWAERRAAADYLYTFLIRGLLDITDNIVDGATVPPPDVVAHDEPDPYLVVAADKGTAHLSDTANSVSLEYGFWLGDAFASGGSNGYDHKEVGITARGGWVLVRRLFEEIGLDATKDNFTCVGIGDCGGDVFGNGVIEHDTMILKAAFNHRHIFLDPNPDPAKTYAERKRLFDAAGGWERYDESLLSEGGGIFDRHAKSIVLTPQVKEMLGVLQDELPGDAVIRQLLRMPVDLLWNGGIGTYVKASWESHADAGDVTNDNTRVNANELRCKVVGEGGNLGFTQSARVEFGLRGGRLNTDAVDNSGGVDMSDHEVNLKILLGAQVASGALKPEDRNPLIAELTDEVAQQVLNNNGTHAVQISLDRERSLQDPHLFGRAIHWVCRRTNGSPADLVLPDTPELKRRAKEQQGLTRPELAVISANVKMWVYRELLQADAALIPDFDQRVVGYFPEKIQGLYPQAIKKHMLHQAIGMTVSLTEAVADNGAAFFPVLMGLTGRGAAEILGAYLKVADALGLKELQNELGSCGADAVTRYRAWLHVTGGVMSLLGCWLAPGQALPDDDLLQRTRNILAALGRIQRKDHDDRQAEQIQALVGNGVPAKLARRCVRMSELTVAREIALLQIGTDLSDRDAAVRYLSIGQASRFLPTVRSMESHRNGDPWDFVAVGILRTRYLGLLRELVQDTPMGRELRLSVDRAAHRLYWDGMNEVASAIDSILGDNPSVGAFLVGEERLRARIFNRSQSK